MDDFLYKLILPSPVQKVVHPLLAKNDISLFVKREDLIHTHVSGNKWRKLKYNLLKAKKEGVHKIVTFGGAFSNHIHATAAACSALKIPSVGIIRGEEDPGNPTICFARKCGMEIIYVDRSNYRLKEKDEYISSQLELLGPHLLVPEGGSNDLALPGLRELADEINTTPFDVVMVSAGTGGTSSGILSHLATDKGLWVFSSLKGDFLKDEILGRAGLHSSDQMHFLDTFHFGGYGKVPEELVLFINEFTTTTGIPLDPIYNGKLIAGFFDMLKNGRADTSKTYLWIHTGGLQGISAYNYMAEKKGNLLLSV